MKLFSALKKEGVAEKSVNVWVVILSLVLALGLWLYVVAAESPTGERTVHNVEVRLSGTDTLSSLYGFSVLTGYDTTASVTLRGRQSELNALDSEDVLAKIDLSDITAAGSYHKKIQITPPSGMEVVRVTPEYLTVDVDVEKTVFVDVLEPEETYSLSLPDVKFNRVFSAERIAVRGPQTVVDKIAGIKCQVDLGELTENVTKSVPLRFVDAEGNEITDRYLVPAQNTLVIQYILYKEKTVPLVLDVSTVLPGEKVNQRVVPETITVQGSPERIDELTQVVARKISTAEMTNNYHRVTGTVTLEDGLTCPTGIVNYTAETYLTGPLTTTRVALDLAGENVVITPPSDLAYRFEEDSVWVTVRTQYNYLAQVDANSLLASINLSAYTAPGTYPVTLTLSVSEEDSGICYVLDRVTVNVVLS